jgi:hypothetical protein
VGVFYIIYIYIKVKNYMKKTIRLTESDLVKLVKRVINEQSDMRNLSVLYDCLGIDGTDEIHLSEVNPIIDGLYDATNGLEFGSNWDENGIVQALQQGDGQLAKSANQALACFMKKMNIPIVDNNPLLTICKKAFTTGINVPGLRTDFGDKNDKVAAQKALSRLGISGRI